VQGGALVGKYRLQQELGSGGMGIVWLAVHSVSEQLAAIKILHPEFCDQEDIVQRFFNEARAAGAVQDRGIVEIFDFGFTHEGRAYIVMEHLVGESLDARLRREGKLAPGLALRIARDVASSLGSAHARGIVHRDLKPENVFMTRDPEAPGGERTKILDFGIAKLEWAHVKTRTAAVLGTPTYMSPEQCRGASDLDCRSDVYSVGCLLFALLAGFPPFYAEGAGAMFLMHLQHPPPTIASRGVEVPQEVEALIARCLEKLPANRYTSGTELAAAIDAIAQPIISPPPAVVAQATAHVGLPTPPPAQRLWLVAAVVMLAGVVAAIVIAVAAG